MTYVLLGFSSSLSLHLSVRCEGIWSVNSDKNIPVCLLCEQENNGMEQNETGCQTPQAPVLCVNNCGFFGTAATMNMCSKCYKDLVLKQEQANLAASSIQSIMNGNASTVASDLNVAAVNDVVDASPEIEVESKLSSSASATSDECKEVKEGPKRCGACNKRVGLTGFNCRCGSIFCSVHRHYDKHECNFDYRSAGQEAIAKANPVIKAEKLDKI